MQILQGITNNEALNIQKTFFIEGGRDASFSEWMKSMGTNFTCYQNYYNSLNKEDLLDMNFNKYRTILYALHRPFKFTFFYWTILVFILHKFNFKKPVMKIILGHFILRSTGDVLDTYGELYSHYFVTDLIRDGNKVIGFGCADNGVMNPKRWFLTRQIGTVFWYVGEIVADWYPLLRTRAVVKDDKSIIYVYISCAFFNLCKLALIILHWTLNPTKLYGRGEFGNLGVYDKNRVNDFYFIYWTNQLIIIIASLLYDITVFFVLKKNLFQSSQTEIGFLKKFKTISEYRIFISATIGMIFLPSLIVIILIKYFFKFQYQYKNLNFSFDEVRQTIANVQYYMIFIDQIFLLYCNNTSVDENSTDIYSLNNLSNNTMLSSKYPYNHLSNNNSVMTSNNRNSTILSNNRNSYLEFSYLKANPNNNIFNSKNFANNNNNKNNHHHPLLHQQQQQQHQQHQQQQQQNEVDEDDINYENSFGSFNNSTSPSPAYRSSIGYNRNSVGYNRNSMGYNRNSMGYNNRNSANYNRNSFNRNNISFDDEQLNNISSNKFY